MTLAASGTLKAGDGGRLIAEARIRAETLVLKERRTQLLAMVRRLYVEGCLVGDSVDREQKWRESARGVVGALGQVIGHGEGDKVKVRYVPQVVAGAIFGEYAVGTPSIGRGGQRILGDRLGRVLTPILSSDEPRGRIGETRPGLKVTGFLPHWE